MLAHDAANNVFGVSSAVILQRWDVDRCAHTRDRSYRHACRPISTAELDLRPREVGKLRGRRLRRRVGRAFEQELTASAGTSRHD